MHDFYYYVAFYAVTYVVIFEFGLVCPTSFKPFVCTSGRMIANFSNFPENLWCSYVSSVRISSKDLHVAY
jgi:hypothetical protein